MAAGSAESGFSSAIRLRAAEQLAELADRLCLIGALGKLGEADEIDLGQHIAPVLALITGPAPPVDLKRAAAPEPHLRNSQAVVDAELVESAARQDDLEGDIGDVLFLATPHKVYRDLRVPEGKLLFDVWSWIPTASR